jgi:leucyl aminopeptidase
MATSYTVRPRTNTLPGAEVVLLFWKKGKLPVRSLDARRIQQFLDRVGATGEPNEVQAIPFPRGTMPRTLLLVGLGERPTLDTFRRGVATAVQYAKQSAVRGIAVCAPEGLKDGTALGIACVEGAELGGYAFTRYQADLAKRERVRALGTLDLVVARPHVAFARRGIQMGRIFTAATMYARDLVNEPAARVTPQALADEARRIARSSRGRVQVEVLDRAVCEALGMSAFLAVAQGSAHPPFFIHLTYQSGKNTPQRDGETIPVVALIGKGITFDSGGLSLKPAEGMETMKVDMAGAAVVFGVFSALRELRLPLTVHGFVAACENMPSGSAVKPGDVVRSSSGKTIEIRNTDAEGRLTLADVLTEARKVKPTVMVDLATLTGACVVSLGEDVAGLFSNNGEMARRLTAAAYRAGEPVWQMPLVRDYREQLKSTIADLKNITGKRWGGAITAALFLQEFVGDTPWIHLDIAGPAYAEQQTNPVVPVGGSGFGVRTVLRFLQRLVA